MKTYTRKLTEKEKKRSRLSHFKILLAVAFGGLVCYVLFKSSLEDKFKYFAYGFSVLLVFIFSRAQLRVEKDVQGDELTIYEGEILQKFKMGGGRKTNSSLGKGGGRTKTATYFIKLEGIKLRVSARIYKQAKEGMNVQIAVLPKSQYVLSLKEIK